jgi:hypothetical protein
VPRFFIRSIPGNLHVRRQNQSALRPQHHIISVQLVEVNSTKMLWAYSVNKQRGGSKNQQSMAEAIAKHLKDFMEHK